ncbi:MAG: hypothetical protein ACR2GM_01915 [Nocardioidaceae bacterium]
MLVESWRHLEGRIRVSIMSHDATQLPGIMSEHRHATIVDAIEKGEVTSPSLPMAPCHCPWVASHGRCGSPGDPGKPGTGGVHGVRGRHDARHLSP